MPKDLRGFVRSALAVAALTVLTVSLGASVLGFSEATEGQELVSTPDGEDVTVAWISNPLDGEEEEPPPYTPMAKLEINSSYNWLSTAENQEPIEFLDTSQFSLDHENHTFTVTDLPEEMDVRSAILASGVNGTTEPVLVVLQRPYVAFSYDSPEGERLFDAGLSLWHQHVSFLSAPDYGDCQPWVTVGDRVRGESLGAQSFEGVPALIEYRGGESCPAATFTLTYMGHWNER